MKGSAMITRCFFSCLVIFGLSSCSSNESHKPVAHTVEIKGMKFLPDNLSVQKGDTVIWVNHDIVTHDVTEQGSKAWSSSPLPVGKTWSAVIDKSSDYYCSIHPVMKGRVEIR